MRRTLLAVAVLALAAPALAQPPSTPATAAVAAPDRPATDREKDAARHPVEIVSLAGVRAGQTVMDVIPGSGYWSRIFSAVVGPQGRVYAYVPAEMAAFKSDPLATAKAMAAEPGRANVTVVSDPLAEPPPPAFQKTVDVVFVFQNYHDLHDSFMKGADVAAFNRAVFAMLKPGGAYVIVDHAATAGSGLKNTEDLHRIDPAAVRAEVEAAGFTFSDESRVLAQSSDDHSLNVFKPEIRGRTDQFAYRFRKPAR